VVQALGDGSRNRGLPPVESGAEIGL